MPFYIIAILLTLATGTALWFISASAFIGYAIGMAIGITLLLAVVQKLSKKAKHSTLSLSLFYWLTKYKATVYNIRIHGQQDKTARATVYSDAHEYADLLDILKGQMKIPATQAKELAKHALDTAKDAPFEDKVRIALQYWGNEQKNITETT